MSHVVLMLTQQKIETMKKHYMNDLSPTSPPGSVFSAKPTSCTVTAYKSGKVLFQGSRAEAEAKQWMSESISPSNSTQKKSISSSVKKHAYSPPATIGEMSLIGSDEVGTGDFFGPITVAAAYVPKEKISLLKELGVKDSKNLKDPQILEIASQLKHAISFSLLVLDNTKYNELQSKGMSQGKIKAYLHNLAIKNLLKKIDPVTPEAILIDQFAQPDVFFNYLKGQELFKGEKVYLSTGAESLHVAVAAASILARAAFVKQFELLSEKAGFKLPKGAGPQVDQAAAKLIIAKGTGSLHEYTKVHFANTEKAKAILNKKRN
ncbi:ribonuclease HIII [Peribacillus alkalitolerans]|uniref:ribonuclease HIII n=1 Tax=Peribacillus alkalitolerans TaxID=1550385 RepID=UPI0013D19C65|nr:ribonuclease HIII [Peribacillus alkalitolerans]